MHTKSKPKLCLFKKQIQFYYFQLHTVAITEVFTIRRMTRSAVMTR